MKKSILFFGIAIITTFAISSCDLDTDEEKGREAAREFCKCRETKSESKCNDELNKNYKSYLSSEFKTGFDAEGEPLCGATVTITRN